MSKHSDDTPLIRHVKNLAKQRHKEHQDKCYNFYLNQVSTEFYFKDYFDLLKTVEVRATTLSQYWGCIRDIIESAINENVPYIGPQVDLSGFHHFNKTDLNGVDGVTYFSKIELTNHILELFEKPLDTSSNLHLIEWLTAQAINKERLKILGRDAIKYKEERIQAFGILLISTSHYLRSLMDCCRHETGEHIVFEEYIRHWLPANYPVEESSGLSCAMRKLHLLYPPKPREQQELFNHSTSWAPRSWLKRTGRIT